MALLRRGRMAGHRALQTHFPEKSAGTVSYSTVYVRVSPGPLAPGPRTASAGNLPGRRTAARWRGGGVAPGGAGSRGPPASAPAGRGALGRRADPRSSGRAAREQGQGAGYGVGARGRGKKPFEIPILL